MYDDSFVDLERPPIEEQTLPTGLSVELQHHLHEQRVLREFHTARLAAMERALGILMTCPPASVVSQLRTLLRRAELQTQYAADAVVATRVQAETQAFRLFLSLMEQHGYGLGSPIPVPPETAPTQPLPPQSVPRPSSPRLPVVPPLPGGSSPRGER